MSHIAQTLTLPDALVFQDNPVVSCNTRRQLPFDTATQNRTTGTPTIPLQKFKNSQT